MLRYPTGPLFRSTEGEPWNRQSVACIFGRLQLIEGMRKMKELGITVDAPPRFDRRRFTDKTALKVARAEQEKKIYERRKALCRLARKHGRKFSLYHFRHSWATRALQRGVDPITVAILMGHSDPSTLARVYQHLAHDPEFLRTAIKRATG